MSDKPDIRGVFSRNYRPLSRRMLPVAIIAGAGILIALVVLLMCNSPRDTSYTVEGHLPGKANINLRIVTVDSTSVTHDLTAARDGAFTVSGNAPRPRMVEILDNDYRVLTRLWIQGGEKLSVSLDPSKGPAGVSVKGLDGQDGGVSARWAAWLGRHAADNAATLDNAVARYAADNPADILSCLLLLTQYHNPPHDPTALTRLVGALKPAARPAWLVDYFLGPMTRLEDPGATAPVQPINYFGGSDSLETWNPAKHPASLLVFTTEDSGRDTAVVATLRRLEATYSPKRLALIDFSLDTDTMTWRRITTPDSASWTRAWAGPGVSARGVAPLAIPSLPYYIVTDSTGAQRYRGTLPRAAIDTIHNILH